MRRLPVLLCCSLLAVGLTACGASTVSTSSFKGEQHEVAQAISNLQADASAGEEKKLCANDLAGPLVARLGGAKGCEAALKSQLAEVDSLEVSVLSVQLKAAGKGQTAAAQVKSVHSGKMKPSTLSLVKEGGRWKISGVG